MRTISKTTLVRIRAVARKPAELGLIGDRAFFFADGRIEHGRISVRTLAKKPLVYAEVSDAGRAQLFAARMCQ